MILVIDHSPKLLRTNVCKKFLSVKVVTVNCARIIHGNQVATNGVVHIIDRVISAVGNTIMEVLDVNDELSSFSVRNRREMMSHNEF